MSVSAVRNSLTLLFLFWTAQYSVRVYAEAVANDNASDAVTPTVRGSVLVVLVGGVEQYQELAAVLIELLEREGIRPSIEKSKLFKSDAFLAELDTDVRVRVYIVPNNSSSVHLYFRGPNGRRFVLRELNLPGGLDEVGRESIAQVVATSVAALLDLVTPTGVDRETARATLSHEEKAKPTTKPIPLVSKPTETAGVQVAPLPEPWLRFELGSRGALRWTGAPSSASLGIGVELGLAWRPESRIFHRERLSCEYYWPTGILAPELDLKVAAFALRGGVDFGISAGLQSLLIGLGVGLDIFRIEPENLHDPSFTLSGLQTSFIPMLRTELRYELSLWALSVSAALFADIALRQLRFDLRDGESIRHIAEHWLIQPGFTLVLAWRPMIY